MELFFKNAASFFLIIFFSSYAIASNIKDEQAKYDNALTIKHQKQQYFNKNLTLSAKKSWKIAVYLSYDENYNTYIDEILEGLEEASVEYGVELIVDIGSQLFSDFSKIKTIERLLSKDINGLIIAEKNSYYLSSTFRKFKKAGIPIISYDYPIDSQFALTQIIFNNYDSGYLLGKWVLKKLNNVGKVIILEGEKNDEISIDRRNGILDSLAEGKIEILSIKNLDNVKENIQNKIQKILDEHKKIDAILSTNKDIMLGTVESSNKNDILIAGIGYNKKVLQAIQEGKINATIDQKVKEQIKMAIQLMIRKLEENELFQDFSEWTGTLVIEKNNISAYSE